MIDPLELHALADGELSPEREKEVLAQLANEPRSAEELQSIQAMKSMLQSNMEKPECDALWERCQSRLEEIDRSKRVESFIGRYAWGICGVFFLAIVVGGVMNRVSPKSVRANDVAGFVAGLTPIPVSPSQSQQDLEPMIKQAIGDAFKAKPARMHVVSISRNDIPGQRAGSVQLADDFGIVTIMAMPDVQKVEGVWEYEDDNRFRCSKVDGMNALFWNERGIICMVVGQRSYDELHTIVTSMQPQK